MPALLRRRTAWLVNHGAVEAAARITSANNRWADLGSRGSAEIVCAEARALGLRPRRVDVPAEWRQLAWLA